MIRQSLAALAVLAATAQPSLAAAGFLATPALKQHISTILRFRPLGASTVLDAGNNPVPELSATVFCPGTTNCYLWLDVKVQFANASTPTDAGLCAKVDGIALGGCPSVGDLQGTYYQMFGASFAANVTPGKHAVTIEAFVGAPSTYSVVSGQYSVYKR